ncbi:sarcosine oxidase subunit gamma [Marinomonas sp. A79]|uniref:Sarcosine oxidase subunit gamma n=1 Tax=Marinomonas vulgaris TaxID=2823372 RepID=A0ABS5H9Y3_9GAMM|nr:sarcosine oxidase subunit gamma [Marinomonas vulgaris]MBR7888400.1 sarcosine oxidase subunit gamma [Marinomonas vulgaris]
MGFYNLSSAPELRKSMLNLDTTASIHSSISMKDCSVFSRVGFRGIGAEAFLNANKVPVPAKPNQSLSFQEGLVVLRLSKSEFWLMSTNNQNHEFIAALEAAAQGVENLYRLYCQHSHACFLIEGQDTGTMFAKVCGVDLSAQTFNVGDVVQTSVARISAIVTKQTQDDSDYILLFADIASVQYLWEALTDASAEFA